MTETVVVTGASGYLAAHVVQQLLEAGNYKVRGTVRSVSNEEKVAPLKKLCPDAKYPLELVEADLLDDKCWPDAIKGCTYVIHTASPFPAENPENEDEVIKPAVDGTLNVLQACKDADGLKRVVLTSSTVAITDVQETGSFTEADWADPNKDKTAYFKSKVLAEKAAWQFMENLSDEHKFELAVINPSFIMGPVLTGPISMSMSLIKRLMEHDMPLVPKMNFTICDVRDAARAHIAALTIPEAVGHRHIVGNRTIWMSEMAKILSEEFKSQGYCVPTREVPNWGLRLMSYFDKSVVGLLPSLGKVAEMDNTRMKKVLGITPHPMENTLIEMVYSMIESGKIKKTEGYKGQPSS